MKGRIRELTRIRSGESSHALSGKLKSYLRGWYGYYGISETKTSIQIIEGWMRRRIRAMAWRRWKTARNRYRKLRSLGVQDRMSRIASASRKGSWRNGRNSAMSQALNNHFFTHRLGIPTLETVQEAKRVKAMRATQ